MLGPLIQLEWLFNLLVVLILESLRLVLFMIMIRVSVMVRVKVRVTIQAITAWKLFCSAASSSLKEMDNKKVHLEGLSNFMSVVGSPAK